MCATLTGVGVGVVSLCFRFCDFICLPVFRFVGYVYVVDLLSWFAYFGCFGGYVF